MGSPGLGLLVVWPPAGSAPWASHWAPASVSPSVKQGGNPCLPGCRACAKQPAHSRHLAGDLPAAPAPHPIQAGISGSPASAPNPPPPSSVPAAAPRLINPWALIHPHSVPAGRDGGSSQPGAPTGAPPHPTASINLCTRAEGTASAPPFPGSRPEAPEASGDPRRQKTQPADPPERRTLTALAQTPRLSPCPDPGATCHTHPAGAISLPSLGFFRRRGDLEGAGERPQSPFLTQGRPPHLRTSPSGAGRTPSWQRAEPPRVRLLPWLGAGGLPTWTPCRARAGVQPQPGPSEAWMLHVMAPLPRHGSHAGPSGPCHPASKGTGLPLWGQSRGVTACYVWGPLPPTETRDPGADSQPQARSFPGLAPQRRGHGPRAGVPLRPLPVCPGSRCSARVHGAFDSRYGSEQSRRRPSRSSKRGVWCWIGADVKLTGGPARGSDSELAQESTVGWGRPGGLLG